jgi:hypothetical protein
MDGLDVHIILKNKQKRTKNRVNGANHYATFAWNGRKVARASCTVLREYGPRFFGIVYMYLARNTYLNHSHAVQGNRLPPKYGLFL